MTAGPINKMWSKPFPRYKGMHRRVVEMQHCILDLSPYFVGPLYHLGVI